MQVHSISEEISPDPFDRPSKANRAPVYFVFSHIFPGIGQTVHQVQLEVEGWA